MKIAKDALPLWGLAGARITLAAARENAVYRVDHPNGRFALRLHRRGYRTDGQLAAELDWMAMLAKAGISVPAPLISTKGRYLHIVGGTQIDVLHWLNGQTFAQALPAASPNNQLSLFNRLGRAMARMHLSNDNWSAAAQCDRPSWNAAGLVGDRPLWDRFWDNPSLTSTQKHLMVTFRRHAQAALEQDAGRLDYGLIHADLVPGNILCDGDTLHMIDFDDGGFGYRLFEVATALLKHMGDPAYPDWQDALITGYTAERPLDTTQLPLFMALRAATYVGWNITRADEDPSGERNARFIAQACTLMSAYLDA